MDLQPVGYIVGEVETQQFTFVTSPEIAPPRLEYLVIPGIREHVGDEICPVDLLAQVTRLQVASPVLDDELTYQETQTILSGSYSPTPQILGTAIVLGYILKTSDGRTSVRLPRSTAMPGQPLYTAPDEILQEFFTRNIQSGIEIGTLINRSHVTVSLDPNGLRRHLAIIAQTGAGKSYLSGLLLENLLQLGATILVFDPNSDYVCLRKDSHRQKTAFADSVSIYRVPGVEGRRFSDEEIGGCKDYTIQFSQLDADEIADLAGIRRDATNMRQAIKLACEDLRGQGIDYRPNELLKTIEEMAGISSYNSSDVQIDPQRMAIFEEKLDDENPFAEKLEEKTGISIPRIPISSSGKRKGLTPDVVSGAQKSIKHLQNLLHYGVWGFRDLPVEDLLNPMSLSVIDLAGMEQFISEFTVDKTLREIWSRAIMGKLVHPVFVVLEEAHNFVPGKDGYSSCAAIINKIAAEGRKFKVFLIVITQRPHKINQDTLSQCGSQIVMKLTNPEDQQAVRRSSESLSENLFSDLPGLNIGEAIILGQLTRIPTLIKVGERVSAEGGSDIDVVKALQAAMDETKTRRISDSSISSKPRPKWEEDI